MSYLKRKKKVGYFLIILSCCWATLLLHSAANAEEAAGIGPNAFLDTVILLEKHTVNTSTTLYPPFDIVIQNVILIGNRTFTASVTRSNTEGEILLLTAFGIDFGDVRDIRTLFDADIITTPKTGLSAGFAVYELAYVTVVTTLLYSSENEPGPMTLRLAF